MEKIIEKRVACLYRVSSQMQVSTDNDIPVQRNACMEFISKQPNWKFKSEYLEKGVSGFKKSTEDRDVLQQIRLDATAKKFDILLVFMFDRLGRRDDETPFLVNWFVKQGIEVWSVKEGQQQFEQHIDKLLNYIRYWQANGESIKTSMRVDEAIKQMTKQGLYSGGRTPYGYKLVETDQISKKGKVINKLEIEENTASVIRTMFELAIKKNYGVHRIARYLNEQGIPAQKGGQWSHCTISTMMRNPIYKGYFSYGKTTAKGSEMQHRTAPDNWVLSDKQIPALAIVPEDIWDAVWNKRNKIKETQQFQYEENMKIEHKQIGRSKLLFIGLARCGCCGSAMVTGYKSVKWTTEDGVQHRISNPVYKCVGKSGGKLGCTLRSSVIPETIEGAVLDEVYGYLDRLGKVDLTHEIEKLQKQNTAENEKIIRQLTKDKAKLDKELNTLKDEVVKAITGESAFAPDVLNGLIAEKVEALARLTAKLEQEKQLLEQRQLEQRDLIDLQKMIPVWREEFEKSDIDVKKVLLAKIIESVTVYNDKVEIKLKMQIEDFLKNSESETMNGCNMGPDRH